MYGTFLCMICKNKLGCTLFGKCVGFSFDEESEETKKALERFLEVMDDGQG